MKSEQNHKLGVYCLLSSMMALIAMNLTDSILALVLLFVIWASTYIAGTYWYLLADEDE